MRGRDVEDLVTVAQVGYMNWGVLLGKPPSPKTPLVSPPQHGSEVPSTPHVVISGGKRLEGAVDAAHRHIGRRVRV